jgi:peptidoglycan/LPS O-acetylase OafA/YrhL
MAQTTQTQFDSARASNLEVRSSSAAPVRIEALDFTKGALVLFMVLYHWLNYFVSPEGEFYRYLRFLTPSFLFITGFFVSQVYLCKYAADDPRLPKRLFTRALKLVAIFVILNLSRAMVAPLLGSGHVAKMQLKLQDLIAIFVSGNLTVSAGKLVAFFILVPISYVLMLSAVLVIAHRFYRYSFHFACAMLLIASLAMRWSGAESQYLELVGIGILGVVIGFNPVSEIDKFVRHPILLTVVYALYTIAITIWDVPFSLEVAGVCLTLAALYLLGTMEVGPRRVQAEVVLLGKYSLFGYISQIAILQILGAAFRHFNHGTLMSAMSFIAAFVLTIASVELVDKGRTLRSINIAYKAVFN